MAYGTNILTNPSAETRDMSGWTNGIEIIKIDTTDYDWVTCKELSGLSISGGELCLILP